MGLFFGLFVKAVLLKTRPFLFMFPFVFGFGVVFVGPGGIGRMALSYCGVHTTLFIVVLAPPKGIPFVELFFGLFVKEVLLKTIPCLFMFPFVFGFGFVFVGPWGLGRIALSYCG